VNCFFQVIKGLVANTSDKIALEFGPDLVVATSTKPQAWQRDVEDWQLRNNPGWPEGEKQDVQVVCRQP